MSVSSMANHAVARRFPASREAQAVRPRALAAPGEEVKATPQDKVTQALEVVTAYIPTEILTLYVATIAAIQGDKASSALAPWAAFLVFLVATPVVVWLIYAAKFRAQSDHLPWKPADWPKWEMVAGIVAYLAWALALPGNPFMEFGWYSSSLAGIAVMATAALLGLLTPIVHPEAAEEPGS